jgi:hypothetical protein
MTLFGWVADKFVKPSAGLPDYQADVEVWHPVQKWLTELTAPDAPPSGAVTPTAADARATAGGGGHSLREQLIQEMVDEYRTKLRFWFSP